MASSRKRQRTLLEFASNSPTTKHSAKRRKTFTRSISDDNCNSDPGKIQFEQKSNDEDDHPDRLQTADEEVTRPRRYATRAQVPRYSPVVPVDSSSEGEETTRKKRSTGFKPLQHHVVVSDESESQEPQKRHRLVKGRRPKDPTTFEGAEDDDGNLIEEVDEDSLCHSECLSLI